MCVSIVIDRFLLVIGLHIIVIGSFLNAAV
jgi:hypothetical protein